MAGQVCGVHQTEMKWKEGGISKTSGKPYKGFWSCSTKDASGNWCKFKPDAPTTPGARFENDLNRSSAQMDNQKKDSTISRLAIAKEFIGRGDKWCLETVKEAESWLAWCEGRKPHVPVPTNEVDMVPVDEIPY